MIGAGSGLLWTILVVVVIVALVLFLVRRG